MTAANNRRRVLIRASRSPWVTPSNCILLWVRRKLGLLLGFEPGPPAELPSEKLKRYLVMLGFFNKMYLYTFLHRIFEKCQIIFFYKKKELNLLKTENVTRKTDFSNCFTSFTCGNRHTEINFSRHFSSE